MFMDERKKLAKELNIPAEDASRIIIEKQKAMMQSEIRFHTKSLSTLIDKLRKSDPAVANAVALETIRFLLARNGTPETIDEISAYLDHISENFLEKALSDSLKDDY
jgi:hypothetical protein